MTTIRLQIKVEKVLQKVEQKKIKISMIGNGIFLFYHHNFIEFR